MDLKEKNVKSIFDEIGFMNNKRLGRCFQTRRKKYYFDTGTGKVFEVNSNVYYILQKILDNADKEDLLNDSDVTVEALVFMIFSSISISYWRRSVCSVPGCNRSACRSELAEYLPDCRLRDSRWL